MYLRKIERLLRNEQMARHAFEQPLA